jgi:hypothetical protein
MIRITGRNAQAAWEDLPSASLWPMPGILILLVCGIIGGILFAGVKTSGILIAWIFTKIKAGVFSDWSMPLILVFYGWVALVVVLGILLTASDASGVGARESAELARSAWFVWDDYKGPVQELLRNGEVARGYLQVDHRRMLAPALFERLYTLLLLFGHILVLQAIQAMNPLDPYMAAAVWLRYGLAAGLMNVVAVAALPVSAGFAVILLVASIVTQAALVTLDPALGGAGVGMPPFTLTLILVLLPFVGVVVNSRKSSTEALVVATNRGLRRVVLDNGQVTSWEKADAPLLVMATPTASGVKLQVGSKDGRDKLRPFRCSGDAAGAGIKEALESQGLKVDLQGADESSGIAGRLGEVPALGWILLLSIAFMTQKTVLPPVTNWFQVTSVFDAFGESWREEGKGEELGQALERLLDANPHVGPAQLTEAEILAEGGDADKARFLLQRLLRKREPWPNTPLVVKAKALLKKLDRR